MDFIHTKDRISIDNKVLTKLDTFVINFTNIFQTQIDKKLMSRFMNELHVSGETYGITF
jgi:hypothetical protein